MAAVDNLSRAVERVLCFRAIRASGAHGTTMAVRFAMVLRRLLSLAVPVSVAVIAFLHAHALGALVGVAAMTSPPASIAPFAEARAATTPSTTPKSAAAILERNIFDHLVGPLRDHDSEVTIALEATDPSSAPPCEGVRAVATVRGEDSSASLAALDVDGKHLLRRLGGDVPSDMRVAYVAEDRVWLSRNGALCQARVFSPPAAVARPEKATPVGQTRLESELAKKIVKTGPNDFQIDRGAVQQILEAHAELMKTPLVPEKEGNQIVGFRLVKVRDGSVLASLGLESGDRLVSINGIELANTERMIEAYARLRTGTVERLSLHVVRRGKPTNLDYVIR